MPIDFTGIPTTRGREYITPNLVRINEGLREIPIDQRAAILGSIIEESGGNPYAKNPSGAYQGLLQWGADRYRPQSRDPEVELNNQIQYIKETVNNPSDGKSWTHGGKGSGYNSKDETYNTFHDKDISFDKRFRAFSYGYVRPKGKEDSYNNRLKVGKKVLNKLVVDEVLSRPKPDKVPKFDFDSYQFVPKKKFDEGGYLENTWDNLSMKDKAEMMRVAISNGITTLPEIREAYNKFADGGDTQDNSGVKQDLKDIVSNFSLRPTTLRDRFYRHFDPYSAYTNRDIKRAVNLVIGGADYAKRKYPKKDEMGFKIPYSEGAKTPFDDAVWGTYLQIPTKDRKYKTSLVESKYRPTKGNDDEKYYTIPIQESTKEELLREGSTLNFNQNANTKALFGYNMGTSTVGRGIDNKGEYISYYDKWDINPLHGDYVLNDIQKTHPVLSKFIPDNGEDAFRGITKPVSFYDRIYLDDYYGVKSELDPDEYYGGYLPEVIVTPNKFAKGGYIPSNTIKKRISNWEGSSMKTNRSFGAEARDFNNVIPAEIRSKLSPNQLDALYSYGYNVGMGNLKKRVLPTLTAYANGNATKEDVQRSMWASRDNELKGLTTRRNAERELFGGNYRSTFTGTGKLGVHIDPTEYTAYEDLSPMIDSINIPQMEFPNTMKTDPTTFYKPPVIDDTLFQTPQESTPKVIYNPTQERLDRLQAFNTVMGMLGQSNPILESVGNGTPGLLSYVSQIYS